MNHQTFLALACIAFGANGLSGAEKLTSPDGDISLTFELRDGRPTYFVDFKGKEVIAPSGLGFDLFSESGRNSFDQQGKKAAADALSLKDGFELVNTTRDSVDENWEPVWGEETLIRNNYNEMSVTLRQPAFDRTMVVRFRAYDDGIGFRYEFPGQPNLNYFVIAEEDTEFAMTGDHTAYWIPGDYDTQEYNYTKSRLSEIRGLFPSKINPDNASTTPFSPTGVQTALQLKTDDGIYLNIHEAGTIDYPTMHLNLNDTTMTFHSWLTP
ncbi:MAG: glycoside hydrolase family 97 N-terminal domain-containing protein, partial [Duncaniella dubosii]|nr:glycoside hydrolase family 97 N-terminal domain-containing protein [Duncaniella dubosii]